MSECTIKKPFTGSAEELLAAVKAAAKKDNALFDGTTSSGVFTAQTAVGEVKGTYAVEGSTLKVDITKKPWVAPCNAISETLDGFLTCPACAAKSR